MQVFHQHCYNSCLFWLCGCVGGWVGSGVEMGDGVGTWRKKFPDFTLYPPPLQIRKTRNSLQLSATPSPPIGEKLLGRGKACDASKITIRKSLTSKYIKILYAKERVLLVLAVLAEPTSYFSRARGNKGERRCIWLWLWLCIWLCIWLWIWLWMNEWMSEWRWDSEYEEGYL